ncbi:uncharacterized protein LOC121419177 isoform X3 [Lytechinus variegatus]|uniref:uncharacterized protein LOC121419177 isoform X3 n=1 Tax=Lytechinus variegatus TaxID=7654 RepID=UPI001BB11050|nr:uncharacterized protein LOC121419177 isoform X3 [Lytechinus variegatus]
MARLHPFSQNWGGLQLQDMSMDIAPTLITLYDSVAANGQVDEHPHQGEEEEERLRPQQDCESHDQEEPIAFVPSATTLAAVRLGDSEGSLIAVDDVTQENKGKCSKGESDNRGREGCESSGAAAEEQRLNNHPANHSYLHAAGGRVPLVDSAAVDSYLDRTTQEKQDNAQNGGGDSNSVSSANIEHLTSCGKVNLHGARDNNFNVEHSSRMVSSDNPGENMAIDVDFNSNSNNDCRPRAHSADLLSDSRRWSQRQRPASAEITTTEYLESGACSPVLQQKHEEVQQSHAPIRQNSSRINPPIIVTTTPITNEAMSPPTSPPTSPPMSPTFQRPKPNIFSMQGRTYLDRIVDEIIDTERSYVGDLGDIIKGYNQAMKNHPEIQLSQEKFDTLFCNLEDIHSFNRELLADLEQSDEDPVKLADCFLEVEDEFCIYTKYCTNYPKAVDVLTECMQDPVISDFFREQQAQLNHGLALGAYLLKPVQRILKYHLLFQDMMKHYKEEQGRDVIARALKSMTNVAWHINDMKRKHEASVHVQEIQSQLHGWQDDLNTYGDLVLEGIMRMHGARGDRFIYLFERALLIGKKHENTNLISIKTQITCANLMLIESVPKEPLGFNVIPFDNSDLQYTIIAKSQEQKKQWTHEIKRLILENYQSNIPTKVKELILGTRAAKNAKDEIETESKALPSSPQEPSMSRDRKERKSRKKHKRRNSEPMGKLQRGQKQVKAAVENIIIGMKRPDLSKLASKRSADIPHDDGTEDSLDEIETNKTRKSEPVTPDEKGESSLAPLARPEEMRDEYGAHQTSRQDTSPSSSKKLVLSKSLGDKKESNRDSGIGSMNLSEHLKLDSEDKSSADEAKAGDGRTGKKRGGAVRKRENGINRQDGLDDTEEEEGEGAKGSEGESPDELEALEQLSDDNHLDRDPLLDIELSPKPSRRSLSTIHGPELFKLRRVNLKEYRPLNDRFSKDHDDVWVPMTGKTFSRNRSFSHIPTRPQSADVTTHPHFQKLRLSRTRSDDSSLHTWAELAKCRSDPNITDHKSDLGDSIKSNNGKETALGSSASTFGTGDGDLSSLSSHENLTDSINMAFQQLGAKYAAKAESESGNSTPCYNEEKVRDSEAATRKEKVSIILNDEDVLLLDKEDTESSHRDFSNETCSTKDDDDDDDDDTSFDSPEEEELSAAKKKVQRLARKYSKMIKHQQQQSTIVVTRKNSESSSSENDGKQVAWAVTHGQGGTVIKRFEIDSPSGSRKGNSVRSTTDSEDDRSSGSRRSITRGAQNRKSVRDFVRRFEVTKSTKPEPKVVTPVQDGIKERLKSFQQETKQPNKSPQHRSSMGFKKLSERRKELEEWVAKPKQRSRHNSEGKDSTDGLSFSSSASDAGDLSFTFNSSYQGSYASSLHSSGRSSPCIEARIANINAIKDGLLESISRLTSHGSATEDEEVTPAMFKSIRERFEELEKAAHKPIPKTVSDPQEEIKGGSVVEGDDDDTIQDITDIHSCGETDTNTTLPNLDLDLPFPEVFDTSSSELSAMGLKSSESLNTRLDALDISSDNSASDAKQFSSSSDLLFPEIEKLESGPPVSETASTKPVSNVKITTAKLSDSCHQVSLEISLTSKKRESAHPTTLDVLSLYEGLSEEEQKMLSPEPALNRSESSESSYKDAISVSLTSPTSEDYVTAPEEH